MFKSHASLTEYFNQKFPLPQLASWKEYQVPNALSSRMISCLLGTPLTMESWLRLPEIAKSIGPTGQDMQQHSDAMNSSPMSPPLNETSLLRPLLQGSSQVSTGEEILSRLKPLQTRYRPSPRPSSWQDRTLYFLFT